LGAVRIRKLLVCAQAMVSPMLLIPELSGRKPAQSRNLFKRVELQLVVRDAHVRMNFSG
jgi:hypothetical protein